MDGVIDRMQEWRSPAGFASLQATIRVARFPEEIGAIAANHRPSRMPFFKRLAGLPNEVARDPALLGDIHLVYQSAMHAIGAPHRSALLLQSTRAFRNMGAKLVLDGEELADPEESYRRLDPRTAQSVRAMQTLYLRSLGARCVVEIMSEDWVRALADALSVHFPQIADEPYFAECFDDDFAARHAEEAIAMTQRQLSARPELVLATLRDARLMAGALDGVWHRLDEIVAAAG
jgi:hypothetical protein